jgi:hypothetical protein
VRPRRCSLLAAGSRVPGRRRAALVLALLSALALLAVAGAGTAWARAGGGQSYGGGHSGSGGGGGGGELIFFVLRLWFQFCVAYPQFGIPITVVVIVVWVR